MAARARKRPSPPADKTFAASAIGGEPSAGVVKKRLVRVSLAGRFSCCEATRVPRR